MQLRNIKTRWDGGNFKECFSWEFGVIFSLFILIGIFNKDFTYIGFRSIYIVEYLMAGLCISLFIRENATGLKRCLIRKETLIFGLLLVLGLIHWGCSFEYGLTALRYGMIVFYFLLFWVGFQLAIGNDEQIRILLYAILSVSTFINAVKILFYQFNHVYLNQYEQFRVSHNEVDVLGAAISLIILLVLFKKFNKIFALSSLALNFTLIFLATKRTAVIGLALCAIVYFVMNYQKINLKKLFRITLILGGLGALFLLGYYFMDPQHATAYYNFLIHKFDFGKEDNSTWRMEAWKIAWDKLSTNPFWGIGFGKPIIDTPIRNVNAYDPHNSFLAFLTRTGFSGGMVLAGLIIQTIVLYLKEYYQETVAERKNLILILFLTFLFMIVFAFFNVVLENQYQGIYFYFSLSGIYLMRSIKLKGEVPAPPKNVRMGRIVLFIMVITYFGLIVSPLNHSDFLTLYDATSYPRIPNTYPVMGQKVVFRDSYGKLRVDSNEIIGTPFTKNYIEWDLPPAFLKSGHKISEYQLMLEFDSPPRQDLVLALRKNSGERFPAVYRWKEKQSYFAFDHFHLADQPVNRLNLKSLSVDLSPQVRSLFVLKQLKIVPGNHKTGFSQDATGVD